MAVALTLPGLVLLLLAVAAIDQLLLRIRGRGADVWRRDAQVGSTGFELLHAALSPGRRPTSSHSVALRRSSAMTRSGKRHRAAGSTLPQVSHTSR